MTEESRYAELGSRSAFICEQANLRDVDGLDVLDILDPSREHWRQLRINPDEQRGSWSGHLRGKSWMIQPSHRIDQAGSDVVGFKVWIACFAQG